MANTSITILIADDDRDDALLLTEALQDLLPSGNCIHVTDGIAVLRYIKTNVKPELVFLDLNMPLKNGIDCLKDISNLDLLPNTPIIIYSTSINIRDIDQAYKYGASYYIIKPTSFNELRKIIMQAMVILDRPGSERVEKSKFVLQEKRTAV
jgi:DNA-binding NtrC family response regulator